MIFTFDAQAATVAIVISVAALVAWLGYLVRSARAYLESREQRSYLLVMPVVGVLASLGTFASAMAFAHTTGLVDLFVPEAGLALVSSVGRGALFMGAILALSSYHPPKRKRPKKEEHAARQDASAP